MQFLNDGDYSPWYMANGPETTVPSGPMTPAGDAPAGTGMSSFPTCASTLNQCPCSYGGCMDSTFMEYDANATCDDGSCATPIVTGCTDPNSTNFNPNANADDGSCIAMISGCTDPNAINYNSAANTDDGSCIAVVQGCSDPNAVNYNPNANVDCSGNAIVNVNSPIATGNTTTTTTPTKGALGFSGYSNMNGCQNYNMASGCGNYNMASGCGYSNFNQRGFGGYEDKMWFND